MESRIYDCSGQEVECEGTWPADGIVTAHYADGEIDDHDLLDEARSWYEAVAILTDHAEDRGTELTYLKACD